MNRLRTLSVFALAALPLFATAKLARADVAQDKAAAEVLFEDAQKLMAGGHYGTACPKFAESVRLDRGVGVMLYLADCYEHQQKTASAWIMFREAEDLATQRNDRKRSAIAHARAEALFPQLASLNLAVDPVATVPGLVVKRDGEVVGAAQYGSAIPIDPGKHTVEASAPGKTTWSSSVDVTAGKTAMITVPPLEDVPITAVDAPVVPSTPETPGPGTPTLVGRTQRFAGIAVGGVGVAGLIVGGVFGGLALSKLNASNSGGCQPNNDCTPAGGALRDAAQDRATVSTIGFIAGGVLAAGGVVLYFSAPHAAKTVGLTVSPSVAGGSFVLGGRF